MGSSFRVLKAISLDMYKRLLESSTSNTNSLNTYGKQQQQPIPSTELSTEFTQHLPSPQDPNEDSTVTLKLLRSIPEPQRERARHLINAILESSDFKWDLTGQIIYQGKLIPNSNIVDLVSVATKSTKLRKLTIPGLRVFISFLKSINIPRHYLGLHFAQVIDDVSSLQFGSGSQDVKSNQEPICPHWITFEQYMS